MVALVSIETVLLVLLVVLVAALLRSHAAILRRLGPEDASRRPEDASRMPERLPEHLPAPPAGVRAATAAPELAGMTPTGDALKLAFGRGRTLLAFLSTGCTSCATFWETLGGRPLPSGIETVIVTRGAEREQPAKLRARLPATVPAVMSSAAWEDYAVPGTPYFVLVQDSVIQGEGVATSWQALASLVSDALREEDDAQDRARGIDERLAAAGIGPDHPSLFPGGRG